MRPMHGLADGMPHVQVAWIILAREKTAEVQSEDVREAGGHDDKRLHIYFL